MSDLGHRDIVVIGGSAGGLEALRGLLGGLPADLDAAVFVVLHQLAEHRSRLPEVLSRCGPLPAELAIHGHPIVKGRILVAPPDNHLLVNRGIVSVVRGPKENGHRPAIDPLFRSAANAYGTRVIAVVLSGALDCGAAGLSLVKARGGMALVQDPSDAQVPSMPSNALRYTAVDRIAPAIELGPIVADLVRAPLGAPVAATQSVHATEHRADIVCPLCQGSMVESMVGTVPQMRCHVGHTFTLEGLMHAQRESLESALWAGVRALEESARLARRAAVTTPSGVGPALSERAMTHELHADVIRRMLIEDTWPPTGKSDAPPGP
jgi:two-component system, chemotaxis family, protein-glutamate methylesterase/glutaminase